MVNLAFMHRLYFLILWPLFACCNDPIFLIDKLQFAKAGDYFTIQTGKNATCLHIQKIDQDNIILEEISFPIKTKPKNMQSYVDHHAPNHTSWTQTKFDIKEGKVKYCYSFLQKSFLDTSHFQSFFSILLQLPFQFVAEESRKKIGLHTDEIQDIRKNWEPPLPSSLKTKKGGWQVYRATWPKDGSELSNKVLEIYLFADIPFPIWIEVKAAAYKGKMRMIDLGCQLKSPHRILYLPSKETHN